MLFLDEDALAKLPEAFYDERYCTWIRSLPEGFFPFLFIVARIRPEEGDCVRGEGVVEVCVERTIGGLGIPFGVDSLDLADDGFLACIDLRQCTIRQYI